MDLGGKTTEQGQWDGIAVLYSGHVFSCLSLKALPSSPDEYSMMLSSGQECAVHTFTSQLGAQRDLDLMEKRAKVIP